MSMAAIQLTQLASMHPHLLWSEIITAAAAVLSQRTALTPASFELVVENVPGFGNQSMRLDIRIDGIAPESVALVRRTYEGPRLIELAAIATAGIGLHLAGGHEILDVALRGSRADYLVDE